MPQVPAVTDQVSPNKGFLANSAGRQTSWDSMEEVGREGFFSATKLRQQYSDYLSGKQLEIEEQKEARRYFNCAQWDAEAVKILRQRRQPIITFNREEKKINGIVGLLERMRQDPKAFPRKPRNEQGAEIATATVRYVLDTNFWQMKSSECARFAAIDGYAGVELKLREGDKGDPDVQLESILSEDFFYDPRSRRYDFHDSRWMGIAKWTDEEEAIELFDEKEDIIRGMIDAGSDMTTNADSEFKWIYTNTRRVRLVEHWYKSRSKWCWAFYINDTILDEGVSPFLNERSKTIPRFVMFSAKIDHDGDRYGFHRNYKGAQDEVNQRRSKALHQSNSRRLIMEKGAVDDVEIARREMARSDGVIETNPGRKMEADDTQAQAALAASFQFLQDAKNEIDQSAPATPVLLGGDSTPKNTSGRAINLLQQAGTAELGPFINAWRDWKIRVYRVVWAMCQRYWTADRWIRITDDQKVAQFIQLNGLDLDEWGRPQLVNAIGQIDVDIILDEGPDVVNAAADAYDVITEAIRNGQQFPPDVIVELLPIPGSVKQRILEKMSQPDPAKQAMEKATIDKTNAEAADKNASAKERVSNSLRHTAQSAHLASMAHLNAQDVFLKDNAIVANPGSQGSSPGPAGPVAAAQPSPSVPPPVIPQQLPLPFFSHLPPGVVPVKAGDGNHYVPDHRPGREGKYLMVSGA